MIRRNLVATKLAELSERVARIREHCPASEQGLADDRDALDLVSFNLMLAVQSCLDLASHLIADQGWPPAGRLAESFSRLAERGVIEPGTAAALAKAAGRRNVVAHGYGGIDLGAVFAAATTGLEDLDAFARQVSRWTLDA